MRRDDPGYVRDMLDTARVRAETPSVHIRRSCRMVLALSVVGLLPLLVFVGSGFALYRLWLRQRAALGKPIYLTLLRLLVLVAISVGLGLGLVCWLAWLRMVP